MDKKRCTIHPCSHFLSGTQHPLRMLPSFIYNGVLTVLFGVGISFSLLNSESQIMISVMSICVLLFLIYGITIKSHDYSVKNDANESEMIPLIFNEKDNYRYQLYLRACILTHILLIIGM